MSKKYTILLAEDDSTIRKPIIELLHNHCHCTIQSTQDYAETLSAVKTHWFDLIIIGMNADIRGKIGHEIRSMMHKRHLEKMPLIALCTKNHIRHADKRPSRMVRLRSIMQSKKTNKILRTNYDKTYPYPLTHTMLEDNFLSQILHKKSTSPTPKNTHNTPKLSPELLAAYKELNLTPPCTLDDIKSRYRMLVKQHHPDGTGQDNPQTMQAINHSYKLIRTALNQN